MIAIVQLYRLIYCLLVLVILTHLMTVEIATSAPRGGSHMGQVGVVVTDHMITN